MQLVNQLELARNMGLSDRRIRQLQALGVVKTVSDIDHRYDVQNCISDYEAYKVELQRNKHVCPWCSRDLKTGEAK